MGNSVIETAIAALNEKITGDFDGIAKFTIEGEGTLIVDSTGVRAAEEHDEAEVTLTADSDTFQDILSGDLNPTGAFMAGKLKVDGDMGVAMKLGAILG